MKQVVLGTTWLLVALCALVQHTPVLCADVRGLRKPLNRKHVGGIRGMPNHRHLTRQFDVIVDSSLEEDETAMEGSADGATVPSEGSADPDGGSTGGGSGGGGGSDADSMEEAEGGSGGSGAVSDSMEEVIPGGTPGAISVNASIVLSIGTMNASDVPVGRRLQEFTPTEAEIDTLINNTFDFYAQVYEEAFGDTLVSISPTGVITQDVSPGVFLVNWEAVLSFSSAPTTEEVEFVTDDASTDVYIEMYVQPSGEYFSAATAAEITSVATDVTPTDAPTAMATLEPTTEAPTMAPTMAATTASPTMATSAPTAEVTTPPETPAPTAGVPETAVPTEGEAMVTAAPTAPTDGEVETTSPTTAAPTEAEVVETSPPTEAEVVETPAPTAPEVVETPAPTAPEVVETPAPTEAEVEDGTAAPTPCPGRSTRVVGTIVLELDPSADLTEPTEEQVVEIAQHILQDFGVLLRDNYDNGIRGFSATIDETSTALEGTAYPLGFDATILFSPCAPPPEELNGVFADADYSAILGTFVPTGADNVFQYLTGEASYTGEATIEFK